jgi:hypothetical protein
MRNIAKAVALSVILGGAVLATPAQAWWGGGWPGSGWGGWPGSGWGGPWGGYPGSWGNDVWDMGPMDGTGWGDMTFSTSVGGRGYGRGYNRNYHGYQPYYGYPYGGWGGPGYGYGGPGYGYGGPGYGYGGPGYGYGGYPYGGGYGPGYGRDNREAPSHPRRESEKK